MGQRLPCAVAEQPSVNRIPETRRIPRQPNLLVILADDLGPVTLRRDGERVRADVIMGVPPS